MLFFIFSDSYENLKKETFGNDFRADPKTSKSKGWP